MSEEIYYTDRTKIAIESQNWHSQSMFLYVISFDRKINYQKKSRKLDWGGVCIRKYNTKKWELMRG